MFFEILFMVLVALGGIGNVDVAPSVVVEAPVEAPVETVVTTPEPFIPPVVVPPEAPTYQPGDIRLEYPWDDTGVFLFDTTGRAYDWIDFPPYIGEQTTGT